MAYAESYAMFIALQSYYGVDIYKNIIELMNQGYDFWEALTNITGDNKEVIKNNIDLFLIKNYNWMFLLNAYNLIFIILPLIVIGGYFYKKYKNKKLLKKWEIEELIQELNDDEGHEVGIFLILKIMGNDKEISANTKAPVLINFQNQKGRQIILDNENLSMDFPITVS